MSALPPSRSRSISATAANIVNITLPAGEVGSGRVGSGQVRSGQVQRTQLQNDDGNLAASQQLDGGADVLRTTPKRPGFATTSVLPFRI